MARTEKFRIEGLADAKKALRQLPDATAKNVLRRTGRKVLEPVAERARQLVAVDEGDLRDSIAVSTKLSRRQRKLNKKADPNDVEIYAGAGPLPQAHLQEFGTVDDPPHPFLRPAWDAERNGVVKELGETLWSEIEKSAERVRKKAAKGK